MEQIPPGPDNRPCPFHRKAMKRVCATCPLWRHIRGRNPNTGKEVDEWDCSLAWLPTLLIEVAQQSRSGAAATESFRNEVVALNLAQLNETKKSTPHNDIIELPSNERLMLR